MSKPYEPLLNLHDTERAIFLIKQRFQKELSAKLNLSRVSAPLVVLSGTGINDDLNGVERPVSFPVKALQDQSAEIVQSLAKWKRMALADYDFNPGEGLYTDMNALRPDEELDALHSIYVDQWDWERVIDETDRNVEFLKKIVRLIYSALVNCEEWISGQYPALPMVLPKEIEFIHTTELERRYPGATPKEREDLICQEHRAVFVIGIGAPLACGQPHDGRAPDYDDWSTPTEHGPGLNGDILLWNPVLKRAFELSSMGIRVDAAALRHQLKTRDTEERSQLLFHSRLLGDELPLSIGGGIGQSRLCMFLLHKAHVGEVQSSIWPQQMHEQMLQTGAQLL